MVTIQVHEETAPYLKTFDQYFNVARGKSGHFGIVLLQADFKQGRPFIRQLNEGTEALPERKRA